MGRKKRSLRRLFLQDGSLCMKCKYVVSCVCKDCRMACFSVGYLDASYGDVMWIVMIVLCWGIWIEIVPQVCFWGVVNIPHCVQYQSILARQWFFSCVCMCSCVEIRKCRIPRRAKSLSHVFLCLVVVPLSDLMTMQFDSFCHAILKWTPIFAGFCVKCLQWRWSTNLF